MVTRPVAISIDGKSHGKLCWLEIDLKASKSIKPSARASSRVPVRNLRSICVSSACALYLLGDTSDSSPPARDAKHLPMLPVKTDNYEFLPSESQKARG